MIALINAARNYQHAYEQLASSIRRENANIIAGRQDASFAMNNLQVMIESGQFLQEAGRSEAAIAAEHYHFQKSRSKNEYNRKYQDERRIGTRRYKVYEPQYATDELQGLAERPSKQPQLREWQPKPLSPERQWEIDKMLKQRTKELEEEEGKDQFEKGKDPFSSKESKE
jgi:hypothetical protein